MGVSLRLLEVGLDGLRFVHLSGRCVLRIVSRVEDTFARAR